jgi:hypothetical protein
MGFAVCAFCDRMIIEERYSPEQNGGPVDMQEGTDPQKTCQGLYRDVTIIHSSRKGDIFWLDISKLKP